MPVVKTLAMIITTIFVTSNVAHAADTCAAPPYGSTAREYTAFIETFGMAVWQTEERAQVFLAAVCEAKLLHAPDKLEPLHNLGISNREIEAMTMGELRMRAIREIRARLN